MNKNEILDKLKIKYKNLINEIEQEINNINNELYSNYVEVDILEHLKNKNEYFENKYTSISNNCIELEENLKILKKEKENISRIVDIIEIQIKNRANT